MAALRQILDREKTLGSEPSLHLRFPPEAETTAAMVRNLLPLMFLTPGLVPGEEVSFNRDVRPILSDNCFSCHGADAGGRKADLRLDLREAATAERDGLRAIFPGELAKSELWRRVTSGDPDEVMPPPKSHKTLTDAQKETLRDWIESGAAYERHWAFVPPAPVEPPEVEDEDWPINEIDRFVLARLEAESLSPSPEAPPEILLRRLALDLTGLPPSPEEVDAFVAETIRDRKGPNLPQSAIRKAVDRLLASPHFGEHLAVAWLDAARYADTNGYFGDKPRQMWLWRDWVVSAFNDNLPFDRFTIEQLAGDLLPGATVSQRIATGFNRNHMANNESGSIDEEFRVEYVVDRVDTTMATWQGLTAGCAQCHDHKFDPISQREFYGLFAFFNNVPEQGLIRADDPPPVLAVPSPEQERERERLAAEVKAARESFEPLRTSLFPAMEAWERTASGSLPAAPEPAVFHEPFEGGLGTPAVARGTPFEFEQGLRGTGASFDATRHVEVDLSGFDPDRAWTVGFWVKAEKSLGCPLSLIEAEGDRRGLEVIIQKGRVQVNLVHRWSDSAVEVITSGAMGSGDWHHLAVVYDGSRRASGLRVLVDGEDMPLEVRRDRLTGTIANREPLRLGRRDSGLGFYGHLDEVRIVPSEVEEKVVRDWGRGERLGGILARPAEKRSERDREILLDDFIGHHAGDDVRRARARLKTAVAGEKALLEEIPTVLVMEEMKTPRPAHVLERGLYDQPRERVEPHAPVAVAPWPRGAPLNRLGFAQWLLAEENPLTARVAVNRLWAHCFGEGLVRTPEDFGSQGEPPTHPELLDWLAVRFLESGWDVKALLREIVMSRTYRQSSVFVRRDGEAFDPENRLLARGPSGRLSAEMLRDQALAVSGLLVPKIGGPSVKPYQPPGLWEAVSYDGEERYVADNGEGLWRRSLYTYVKRQAPPPSLLNFDGPTREKCTIRRGRTSTPLQALQLLNDETHVEAARVLADRVLRQPGDDVDRLRSLWRRVLLREAENAEIATLSGLLGRQRDRFRDDTTAADSLLSVGAAERGAGPGSPEHAAWTVVAQAVLNLDETLTKR